MRWWVLEQKWHKNIISYVKTKEQMEADVSITILNRALSCKLYLSIVKTENCLPSNQSPCNNISWHFENFFKQLLFKRQDAMIWQNLGPLWRSYSAGFFDEWRGLFLTGILEYRNRRWSNCESAILWRFYWANIAKDLLHHNKRKASNILRSTFSQFQKRMESSTPFYTAFLGIVKLSFFCMRL